VTEHLLTEPLVLIVGPLHPYFDRKSIRISELHGQPLALLSRGSPSRRLIDRCLEANRIVPRVMLEMNSNEGILATVRCSALATLRVERALSGASELRAVRITGPTLERTTALFWNRNGYRSAAARAVAELIRHAYAAHASGRGVDQSRNRKSAGAG
jgi:LysR family cyn operon transcriptional activator